MYSRKKQKKIGKRIQSPKYFFTLRIEAMFYVIRLRPFQPIRKKSLLIH